MKSGVGEAGIDLSERAISQFLNDIGSEKAEQVRLIEQAETWTCESDPEVIAEVESFWSELDEGQLIKLASSPDKALITLLGHLRAARNFMLLDHITQAREANDEHSSNVLLEMRRASRGDRDASQAFDICISRLQHLERSRMLRRIYGLRRAQMIIEALREVT